MAAAKLLLNASGLKGGNLLGSAWWEEGDLSRSCGFAHHAPGF